MEQHRIITTKADTFPNRNAHREGQLSRERFDKLHLHSQHKTDKDITSLHGYLQTKKANKEALEVLKQKILSDNMKREHRQIMKRRKPFQNETLQRQLSEEFSDKMTLTPKQTIKNSVSKCHVLNITQDTHSITFSVSPTTRTRADTLPLAQTDIKRDVGIVTTAQDMTPIQATGTVKSLQCRPKNLKLDICEQHLGNKCVLKKSGMEKDAENTEQEQDAKSKGKWFQSSVFPPLIQKVHFASLINNKDLAEEDSSSSKQLKQIQRESTESAANQESYDSFSEVQSSTSSWQEESEQLNSKIKKFVAKLNTTSPPSSLKIRRSTIHDISVQSHSKRSKDPVQGIERKKVYGVVNMHTCPNVNVFKDRSWMYQDRRGEKCRYIREPPSPIPPIEHVFHHNKSR